MRTLSSLISIADQFISDRDWWAFHNPKNDSMNILVEAGELAEELCKRDALTEHREKLMQESADVLFAVFVYSVLAHIDIAQSISVVTGVSYDEDISYEQLSASILDNASTFNLNTLENTQTIVLSLIAHASQLGDIFVWAKDQEAIELAHKHHVHIEKHCAYIVAHLVYLASQLDFDLPKAYIQKMEKNALKYPLETSSGFGYRAIKDASRGRQ